MLVEQQLDRAMSVATRVMCMLEGRIALDRPNPGVTREEVIEAYFGLRRAAGEAARAPA